MKMWKLAVFLIQSVLLFNNYIECYIPGKGLFPLPWDDLNSLDPTNHSLILESGANYSIQCRTRLSSDQWTFHSNGFQSQCDQVQITVTSTDRYLYSDLTFRSATSNCTGLYECKNGYIMNQKDTHMSSIYIYVFDPKHLTVTDDNSFMLNVINGVNNTIPCRVTHPNITVTLENSYSVQIENAPYNPQIGFRYNVKPSDSDLHCNYSYNGYSSEESYSLVFPSHDIHFKIQQLVQINSLTTFTGGNLTLKCDIHLRELKPIIIYWSHNKKKLLESRNDQITEHRYMRNSDGQNVISELRIVNVNESNNGTYICHVTEPFKKQTEIKMIRIKVYNNYNDTLDITGILPKTQITIYNDKTSVDFGIKFISYPQRYFMWLNSNGTNLTDTDKYRISDIQHKHTMLTISQVELTDTGNYTIVISNGYQMKNVTFHLNVLSKDVNIWFEIDQSNWERFRTVCKIVSNPIGDLEFYQKNCDSGTFCNYSKLTNVTVDKTEPFSLTKTVNVSTKINSLKCTTHSKGTERQFEISDRKNMLEITDLPTTSYYDLIANRLVIAEGENLTVTCVTDTKRYPNNSVWLYNNKSLVTSQTVSNGKNLNQLIIRKVSGIGNKGEYKCVANHTNQITSYKQFHLKVEPATQPVIYQTNLNGSLTVNLTTPLRLACYSHGLPKPVITWSKDNKQLQMDKRLTYENDTQILDFGYVKESDMGIYTCLIRNRVGNMSATVKLNISNRTITDNWYSRWYIYMIGVLITAILLCIGFITVKLYQEQRLKRELRALGLEHFEDGNVEQLNPDLNITEQAELLPYNRSRWEFPMKHLKLGKQLGSGAFGVVLEGYANGICQKNVSTKVAIKTVRKNTDHMYLKVLASELKIMIHLGEHLNIANMLGACTRNIAKHELYVIYEYCPFGNLLENLQANRSVFIDQINRETNRIDYTIDKTTVCGFDTEQSQTTGTELIEKNATNNYADINTLTTSDLLYWSYQIANGMMYLSERRVIHGDLATRNILLGANNVVKICDFGLAKKLYQDNYKKTSKGPLPIKWLAIETIRDRVFSVETDIWSFGIVLWELFTLGRTPYPGFEIGLELYNKLVDGYRMSAPYLMPFELHQIMLDCWHSDPNQRPLFKQLYQIIELILEQEIIEDYRKLMVPYEQEEETRLKQYENITEISEKPEIQNHSNYNGFTNHLYAWFPILNNFGMGKSNRSETSYLNVPQTSSGEFSMEDLKIESK